MAFSVAHLSGTSRPWAKQHAAGGFSSFVVEWQQDGVERGEIPRGEETGVAWREWRRVMVVVLVLKGVLLGAGGLSALLVPLAPERYVVGFHHFLPESRMEGTGVEFFSLWTYGDAEWYQAIAARGYPSRQAFLSPDREPPLYRFAPGDPLGPFLKSTENDQKMKFAFFPLYPLLIHLLAPLLSLEGAAFFVANLGSFLGFLAVYRLGRELGASETTALRGVVLLALYPFGVFFQASYPEGLFLLLAALAFCLLAQRRYGASALCGALLCLTKGVGVLVTLPLLLGARLQGAKVRDLALLALVPTGLLPYMALNFARTGSWTYFNEVLVFWQYGATNPLGSLARNLTTLFLDFDALAWLSFHSSRLDALAMLVFLGLLVASFRRIPSHLWLYAALLWLTPMLRKDLMSFGRYMSLLFPLFLYGASRLSSPWAFRGVAAMLGLGALATHVMLTHWIWVG